MCRAGAIRLDNFNLAIENSQWNQRNQHSGHSSESRLTYLQGQTLLAALVCNFFHIMSHNLSIEMWVFYIRHAPGSLRIFQDADGLLLI
jgi:hypothetical protein